MKTSPARAAETLYLSGVTLAELLFGIGTLALQALRQKALAGQPASLPKDLGELSITNLVISMRTVNPSDPTLVIIEDDWFAAHSFAVPGNVHLVSTSAWLDGLEALGRIPSAAAVRAQIQAARPNFRADFLLDMEADKIPEGTEWRSRLQQRQA